MKIVEDVNNSNRTSCPFALFIEVGKQ